MVNIHYFYDPMCGWCYGATSLTEILAKNDNIELVMHPGGMIDNKPLSSEFKARVLVQDQHIASMTGQSFGHAYKKRISENSPVVLDSIVTAQAIHVMQKINGRGFEMLKAIQHAHYENGIDTTKHEVLTNLATGLNVDATQWIKEMEQAKNDIKSVIRETHLLMDKWHIQGFPTFILVDENGVRLLPHAEYYSNSVGWEKLISRLFEAPTR
ncbi:DsbA family protein [Arenicella xantha]|uniref:DSBA-like thioredoxin domain-containing protein n=1 Tax=Arenicella xantha TaxID=644221 RepID=A0A395JNM6_9GAMM|nr:DsbA family protein [Arenicella xantha]RBP52913.1 putative protein-disulfide isomerase [Arenicella xantha]